MSEIKYKIIDKNTLELIEEAKIGDTINLKSQFKIDTSNIEKLIEEAKDEVYETELNKEIEKLKKEYEVNLKYEKEKLNRELSNEINSLKSKITLLESDKEKDIKIKEQEIENKYKGEIITLESKIKQNESQYYFLLEKEKNNLKEKYENENKEEINSLINDRDEWKHKFETLRLEKSSLNVKKLGEELEHYCNEEFLQSKIAGFDFATFLKDNEAIKYENENKGTKADYIFKVYSSSNFNEENLLSSVCLEMKNEAIDSTHKKKNSDHYEKLDKDRNKKKCEYALLVSELEWDSNNDSPIKKVTEYEKMYVVRPQYMITFLSLIYSLSMRYKEVLNTINKEKYEFKEKEELLVEFEGLKNKYLIRPLEALEKEIDSLNKNNNEIISLATNNQNTLNNIIKMKFITIKESIDRFDLKKVNKKLDELD